MSSATLAPESALRNPADHWKCARTWWQLSYCCSTSPAYTPFTVILPGWPMLITVHAAGRTCACAGVPASATAATAVQPAAIRDAARRTLEALLFMEIPTHRRCAKEQRTSAVDLEH